MDHAKLYNQIRDGLNKAFVGQTVGKTTKEDVGLAVKRLLAQQEGAMLGYSDVKTEILWKTFTWKMKLKWYWCNKITSIGETVRDGVDIANVAVYQAARDRWVEDGCETEDFDYTRIEYPWFAQPSPKSVITVTAAVKLNTPIEFIPISIQIDEVKS